MERFPDFFDKYKLPLSLSLVGLVLIIGGVFASGFNKTKHNDPSTSSGQDFPQESMVQTQKMISVDVSGAVNKPGVYKLNEGVRVEDAINAAGGISQDASQGYVSKYINMAQKLVDGGKVYIPKEGEEISSSLQSGTVFGVSSTASVNINNATQLELEALPGIGPVTASKIISDRPYKDIGELLSRKIVSKGIFEKIKNQIVIY